MTVEAEGGVSLELALPEAGLVDRGRDPLAADGREWPPMKRREPGSGRGWRALNAGSGFHCNCLSCNRVWPPIASP